VKYAVHKVWWSLTKAIVQVQTAPSNTRLCAVHSGQGSSHGAEIPGKQMPAKKQDTKKLKEKQDSEKVRLNSKQNPKPQTQAKEKAYPMNSIQQGTKAKTILKQDTEDDKLKSMQEQSSQSVTRPEANLDAQKRSSEPRPSGRDSDKQLLSQEAARSKDEAHVLAQAATQLDNRCIDSLADQKRIAEIRDKLKTIHAKALREAWNGNLELALNHVENGLGICAKAVRMGSSGTLESGGEDNLAPYPSQLAAALQMVHRMVCRPQRLAAWSTQDVGDYLSCAVGRPVLPALAQAPDGGELVLNYSLLLPVWAGLGSEDIELLRQIQADIQNRLASSHEVSWRSAWAAAAACGSDCGMMGSQLSGQGYPAHWTPPWPGGDPYQVCVVPIPEHSMEFNSVASRFYQSAPLHRVSAVARVQNLRQWTVYMAMMRAMGSSANVHWLFHGTHTDAVPTINAYGFNRSHHGRNATAYGRGVYFARDAAYSADPRYSPAGAHGGLRYMYFAQVLVGHTTVGASNLIEPPEMPGGGRFDSTCDRLPEPRIFVTYNDAQAYQEYLISFI
jgi:hypothetical protein